MPFTGRHPAAVLPLLRVGLVPSALVIGSMSPDLPYYLPVQVGKSVTHSAAGIAGPDLLLGAVSFLVWQFLVVPLAVAAAPAGIRARLAPALPAPPISHLRSVRAVVLLAVALWIGATTHVVWDEFTHVHRWGYRHIHWLAVTHGPLPGYKWGQYAGGVVGGLLILDAVARWWRRTAPADPAVEPQRIPALPRWAALGLWTAIALATAAGALTGAVVARHRGHTLSGQLFMIATWGGGAGLFAVLGCALIAVIARPQTLRLTTREPTPEPSPAAPRQPHREPDRYRSHRPFR